MDWEGRGGKGGGAGLLLELCRSAPLSLEGSEETTPPSSPNLGEGGCLGRTKEQENSVPGPEDAGQSPRVVGQTHQVGNGQCPRVPESASRDARLSLVAGILLMVARLMEWGRPLGIVSSNTN